MIILDTAEGIHPQLKLLIDALVAKHPTWDFKTINTSKFYGEEYGELKGKILATNFSVQHNTEQIGEIWQEQWGKGRWCYHNSKIARESHRGYGKRTTDIKRAVKEISKYFAPADLAERMEEAMGRAGGRLNQYANNQRYAFDNVWDRELIGHIQKYVLRDRWVEALQYVLGSPDVSNWLKTNLPNLPEKYEAKQKAKQMQDLFHDGHGVLVTIEGEYYHVKNRKVDEIDTFNGDTLPAYLKRSVGMLKLLEGEFCATDNGFKVSPTSFVILNEGVTL